MLLQKMALFHSFFMADYIYPLCIYLWLRTAQWIRNWLVAQETQVRSLGGEDLLEEVMATHCSILAGESHGHRSPAG